MTDSEDDTHDRFLGRLALFQDAINFAHVRFVVENDAITLNPCMRSIWQYLGTDHEFGVYSAMTQKEDGRGRSLKAQDPFGIENTGEIDGMAKFGRKRRRLLLG
jgi:hypothetical protein